MSRSPFLSSLEEYMAVRRYSKRTIIKKRGQVYFSIHLFFSLKQSTNHPIIININLFTSRPLRQARHCHDIATQHH